MSELYLPNGNPTMHQQERQMRHNATRQEVANYVAHALNNLTEQVNAVLGEMQKDIFSRLEALEHPVHTITADVPSGPAESAISNPLPESLPVSDEAPGL